MWQRRNERQYKYLRRHNRIEVITLIRIVLGGRCPGVICPGGQLSLEEIVRVQLSGAIFLVGSCTRAKCSRGNFPGGNCPKWHLSGGQLSRGQLPKGGNILFPAFATLSSKFILQECFFVYFKEIKYCLCKFSWLSQWKMPDYFSTISLNSNGVFISEIFYFMAPHYFCLMEGL